MPNIAIKVSHLTKVYKLYDKPIDRLKESLHPLKKKYHKDFYALNDVSFEIKKGETVGIIGKNGAGKSTLLKIITGVLTPSSGHVNVNGRIASLLELGAGFNPEYTGIENIYLQATLMGYSHQEMEAKIDEILAFADIGSFVYQPVKSYSSGMFARLAFAVAINVEPDILIVDEALSVGDFVFQSKCFQKIKSFRENGVTVLFVSHSSQSIIEYCTYAFFLHDGKIKFQSKDVKDVVFKYEGFIRKGDVQEINNINNEIDIYNKDYTYETTPNIELNENRIGSFRAILRDLNLFQDNISDKNFVISGELTRFEFIILAQEDISSVVIGLSIRNISGLAIWSDNSLNAKDGYLELKKGINVFNFKVPMSIIAGDYLISVGLAEFSSGERHELDQRWPMRKLSVVSTKQMAGGFIYAPLQFIPKRIKD